MAPFSIDLSADPAWLHVGRATAVLGATAISGADVDFVDDVTLAVGEAMLEVCVTPGVTDIELVVDPRPDGLGVSVTGTGGSIDHEPPSETVIDAVLHGLTVDPIIRRDPDRYRIEFSIVMSAAQ